VPPLLSVSPGTRRRGCGASSFTKAYLRTAFPQGLFLLANGKPIPYKAHGFKPGGLHRLDARVAQLVEQRIENPRVTGSIPVPGTTSTL
jgi:hypothetical protein